MDRDRRYGWGNEGRGWEDDRGGRGFGARDRDEDWRQRGGYFGGRDRDEEQRMSHGPFAESRDEDWRREGRDREFGMSGESGRGDRGGGYTSRGWERDRWDPRSSQHGGHGSTGSSEGRWLRETSRERGPYGASPSSYGFGHPGYGERGARQSIGRDWDRDRGGWERDRTGEWERGEPREGGSMLHRMGESLRSAFGGGERGPFFGKGPKGYKRSDERVREEVCERIARQGYIDASEVEVRVQNGEVTLSGLVHDREHKRRLEQLIDDLPGVEDVKNEIRVQRMDVSQGAPSRPASGTTTSSDDNGNRGGRSRTS